MNVEPLDFTVNIMYVLCLPWPMLAMVDWIKRVNLSSETFCDILDGDIVISGVLKCRVSHVLNSYFGIIGYLELTFCFRYDLCVIISNRTFLIAEGGSNIYSPYRIGVQKYIMDTVFEECFHKGIRLLLNLYQILCYFVQIYYKGGKPPWNFDGDIGGDNFLLAVVAKVLSEKLTCWWHQYRENQL